MGLFPDNWPYTNLHELNLDWVIKKVREGIEATNQALEAVKEAEKDVDKAYAAAQAGIQQAVDNIDAVVHDEVTEKVQDILTPEYLQPIVDNAVDALLDSLPTANYSNIIFVGKKGCQYTTVNAAITAAKTYATTTNRVAVLVMPGTYNERIELINNPGIDFFGFNATLEDACTYPDAIVFISGKTYMQGFSFRNTGDTTGNAYAMHLEAQTHAEATSATFKDCTFFSSGNAAIGIGLGTGYGISFYNCRFTSSVACGAYWHNYPGTATSQSMEFHHCIFQGTYAARVDNWGENSPTTYVFDGNTAIGNASVTYRRLYDSTLNNLGYVPASDHGCTGVGGEDNFPGLRSNMYPIRINQTPGMQAGIYFYVTLPPLVNVNYTGYLESAYTNSGDSTSATTLTQWYPASVAGNITDGTARSWINLVVIATPAPNDQD